MTRALNTQRFQGSTAVVDAARPGSAGSPEICSRSANAVCFLGHAVTQPSSTRLAASAPSDLPVGRDIG